MESPTTKHPKAKKKCQAEGMAGGQLLHAALRGGGRVAHSAGSHAGVASWARLIETGGIGVLLGEIDGYGSKLQSWGYAGFSLWCHLPRCHFDTTFLSHSQMGFPGRANTTR